MILNKGDKVKFINETGEAVVVELLDDQEVVLETEDGFEIKYPMSELIKVDPEEEEDYFLSSGKEALQKASLHESPEKSNNKYIIVRHLKNIEKGSHKRKMAEIDLHIEEITKKPGRLRSGEKLSLQLDYAQRCIEEAFELKISRIVFIHGVGEGILRTELRKIFMNYPEVLYHDAPYKEYGDGATEVEIKGLHA